MKTTRIFSAVTALCAVAIVAASAFAQAPNPPPTASLNSANGAPTQTVVYVPQLPNPGELVKAAAAQGMTVDRIEQRSDQVTVAYRSSGGQMTTIDYRPLPEEEGAPAATTTAVTYSTPPPAYYPAAYPEYYPTYYPGYYWPWYPEVAVGVGFGYWGGWGWGGHGWHGRGGEWRGGGGARHH